jgi:hypothetical protein
MSEIGKLAEALAKAQGEMENAVKDSTNLHFKSKYADIASVINAIKSPLSKNGLAFVQFVQRTEGGMELVTQLMHTSGESISSSMPLMFSKQDMQGLGSALTYARRYSLSALVGIAQEDDDGNEAVKSYTPPTATPKIAPVAKPFDGLRQRMAELHKELLEKQPKFNAQDYLKATYGVSESKLLSDADLRDFVGFMANEVGVKI